MRNSRFLTILIFAVSLGGSYALSRQWSAWQPSSSSASGSQGVPWIDPRHPCGPTSLALAARLSGRAISLDDAVAATQPDHLGRTSMAELIAASQHLGLYAVGVEIDPSYLARVGVPVILHSRFEHFMVVVSNSSGALLLLDPPHAPREVDVDFLRGQCTGRAILVAQHRTELDQSLKSLGLPASSVPNL
jgi:ABC-type bacteriocin/lantibiotic exporter with double-glycine peptidase domain